MYYHINHLPSVLPVGVQTETSVKSIRIDVAPWLSRWPGMTCTVWLTRPGESAAYPAGNAHMDGTMLIWHPDGYDTAISGSGKLEVLGLTPDGEARKLTGDGVETLIRGTTLSTTAEPGKTEKPWVDAVLDAADRAEDAAKRAEDAGGGSISPEDVAQAVEDYLKENPVEGVTPEEVQEAVNEYMTKNPVSGLPDGAQPGYSIVSDKNNNAVWEYAPWRNIFQSWDGFGIRVEDGKTSLVDVMKTKKLGLYTVYVRRDTPDNPPGAVQIDSSLRGIVNITTSEGPECYGWILLWDQDANCYMRYIQLGVASEWKQLNIDTQQIVDDVLAQVGTGGGGSSGGEWALIINQKIHEDCVSVTFDSGDNGEVLSEYDNIIIFLDLCANTGDYTSGVKVSFSKNLAAWSGGYFTKISGQKLSEFTGRNIHVVRFEKTGAGVLPTVGMKPINHTNVAQILYLSSGNNQSDQVNFDTPFTVDGPDAFDYETISKASEFETIKIGGYQAVMGAGTVIKIWGHKS